MRAELLADGAEDILDRVETDTTDEMHVHRAVLPFRPLPGLLQRQLTVREP
jgi:hypothetical protein